MDKDFLVKAYIFLYNLFTVKYKSLPFIFLFFLFFLSYSFANFSFQRNLRLGESGTDIIELQKFLNRFPDTKISETGPGSPGNETDYFGPKTQQAVIKFQEKYRNEVLVPNGLFSGTGFVGPSTREKINKILLNEGLSEDGTSETFTEETETESAGQSSLFSIQTPKIFSVSAFQVSPGAKVTLFGRGFSLSANDVYAGEKKILSNLKSLDGTKLEVIIPNDLAEGSYNLWVSNALGDTKNQIKEDFLVVSKMPKPASTILRVEPLETHADEINSITVKITGENFSTIQNEIYSSFGNIGNLRSENGVISFPLSSLPEIAQIKSIPSSVGKIRIPIYLFVKNDSGITQTPAIFYLNLN